MLQIIFVAFLSFAGSTLFAAADLSSDPALDFQRSDLVIIGRVIGVERISESDEAAKHRNMAYFGFYARVRIAISYKGDAKPGQEVLVPIGGYWAAIKEVDTTLAPVLRNTGMRALSLDVGGIYLLSLNKAPGAPGVVETWTPRSRQASILPIFSNDSGPVVEVSDQPAVALDRYITQMKEQR